MRSMQEDKSILRKKRPSSIDNLTLPAPESILGMGVKRGGLGKPDKSPTGR